MVYLLTIIMIAPSAMIMSCINNETAGYKQLVVTEGLAHFSFEYPAFYSKPYVDRSLEPKSTVVKTGGVIQPGVTGGEDLYIYIFRVSDSFDNAKAMLEDELRRAEEHQNFELLDRSPVTIAGTHGERIIYSYYGYHATMEAEAETGTAYIAYFDSEGLIWEVVMIADEYAAAERAEADFEHVVETFKILD